jgi:endoglucanase
MKRFLSKLGVVLALAMPFCMVSCSTDTNNSDSMRTDMTSKEYAQDMGIGINLGNTMEAFWEDKSNKCSGSATIGENTPSNYETCWGAISTTQEIIDGIEEAGFNTVRVPVYWGNMMEDDGSFTISEEYFNRVDEIVNYCLNDGLYVVINIHHYDEYLIKNYPKDEVLDITKNLWTQIATHYKDYSDYLIFEGFNENLGSSQDSDNYSDDELFDYVNEMNQTFVDSVRSTKGNNTNRLLIVSGFWTNIDKTTDERFKIPTDTTPDRIMVSVHYIDNAIYWQNTVGTLGWQKYSQDQCDLLKNAFTDKGIQVFVGECTANYDEHYATNNEYTSAECLEIIMDMATDYEFIPVIWDTNGGMYSRTECKISSSDDQEVISEIAEKIANR